MEDNGSVIPQIFLSCYYTCNGNKNWLLLILPLLWKNIAFHSRDDVFLSLFPFPKKIEHFKYPLPTQEPYNFLHFPCKPDTTHFCFTDTCWPNFSLWDPLAESHIWTAGDEKLAEMDNDDSFFMGLSNSQLFKTKSVHSEVIPTYTIENYQL